MPATAQNSGANGAAELIALASQVGMANAMDLMLAYRDQNSPASNPRYWAVVNFELHSSKPRLYLFDRVANDRTDYLCAHGKGSDPGHTGLAEEFSNDDGSNRTCIGIFRTGETYYGHNGYSLHLDGLSPDNFAARRRNIVMHAASYVTPAFVARHGKTGRSLGCPAVDPQYCKDIIDSLRGGSFLIHWHPQLVGRT